jgi:hypothetical protein
MSGIPMPWLKLPHTYLDNPKLGALPENIQLRFFKLYMLAHQCQQDGVITISHEEIAWKLHISAEELASTLDALAKASLFLNNGRGPEIPAYRTEQITLAQRKAETDKKAGQRKSGKMSPPVSPDMSLPCHAIESESESESDIDIESEKKTSKESSLSGQSRAEKQQFSLTDRLITKSKSDLLEILGIPNKFQSLSTDPKIRPADMIAEYVRCISRTDVRKPGTCTGLNLSRHELPSSDWYDVHKWESLPQDLKTRLGLDDMETRKYALSLSHFQGEEEEGK